MLVTVGRVLRHFHRQQFALFVVDGRADECHKQRVRTGRPALQFGVGLSTDDERMDVRRVFDELHQMTVG